MNKSNEPEIFTQAYNNGKNVFVLVYMNGCPYCEPILPLWDNIDEEIQTQDKYKLLNDKIKLTKIEKEDLNKVKDLINKIESFPTFLHMGKGIKTTKHNPDRDYDSLMTWITKLSNNNVKGGKKKRNTKRKKNTKKKKKTRRNK
jgi:thiol-disulfide isomerase/thioredoxin